MKLEEVRAKMVKEVESITLKQLNAIWRWTSRTEGNELAVAEIRGSIMTVLERRYGKEKYYSWLDQEDWDDFKIFGEA